MCPAIMVKVEDTDRSNFSEKKGDVGGIVSTIRLQLITNFCSFLRSSLLLTCSSIEEGITGGGTKPRGLGSPTQYRVLGGAS